MELKLVCGQAHRQEGNALAASLVLVCHSAKLAEGLRELVEQVTQDRVRVFATGGLDEHTLGSNPDEIGKLLERADSPEGTLVLMDLGSSILATQMLVDDWPAERRSRIVLCEAALVEGAVAAAIQLAAGSTLEEAAQEARHALQPKETQLGSASPATTDAPAAEAPPGPTLILQIAHPMGLHARPAALFVQTAKRFQSDVWVQHETREANAKSITDVLTLGVKSGANVSVRAEGDDAVEALEALRTLVESNFAQLPATHPQQG